MSPSPPSHLSRGTAARVSLTGLILSVGINGGAAYVSPPTSHCRRGYTSASALASAGGRSGSGAETNKQSKSRAPLSTSPSSSSYNNPYVRIQKRGRHYDVQTAVTTFQKTTGGSKNTVDLHTQIHFGDSSYFQYFNEDDTFGSRYDKVLYELIVEDKFLTQSSSATASKNLKQLMPHSPGSKLNPIAPTQSDRNTASQYGLQCQVDGIEYCKEGWVHADLTREEFLDWVELGEKREQNEYEQQQSTLNRQGTAKQPLWALASTSATYPGSELVTSLLRPLTTTSNSASAALTRRLFTHLFLPGDALSGWIRAALWLGVPSPELSIMLVDWSSLSYIGRQSRRRGGVGSKDGSNHNIAPISPIAAPVFLSLLTGNWGTARRLVFGQVLVGGQSNADTSKGGVLIDKRNERAMDVLRESISDNRDDQGDNEQKRIALLYGAAHCRDLHQRLIQQEGMTPIRTEWRSAFRATAPRWGDFVDMDDWQKRSKDIVSSLPSSVGGEGIVKSMSVSTLESVAVGLVILPLYLLIGGVDWVSTMGELGNAVDGGAYLDGMASVLLYLVRHVALYVGISKFVVDWGGNEGIFEEEVETRV